jgi:hypothetical protein
MEYTRKIPEKLPEYLPPLTHSLSSPQKKKHFIVFFVVHIPENFQRPEGTSSNDGRLQNTHLVVSVSSFCVMVKDTATLFSPSLFLGGQI